MSVFNILFLVFCALFITSASLEISGYYKKISLMEYIAKPCMYIFLLAASLMILIPSLPDSADIIFFLTFAIVCGLAGACLQFLPKRKKTVIVSSLLFITSFLCYIRLIQPSFRLFTIPVWASVSIFLIYLILLLLYYNYVIGKRNLLKTAGIALFMIPLMLLHYGTILTLFGQFRLYSIMLFLGSTIFILSQALIVKGFFIKASEKDRLIRMILYIAGTFFITGGYTLMVSL